MTGLGVAFIVGNDKGYFPVIPEVEEQNYPGSIHRMFEHHRHQQKQVLYNARIVDSLSPSRAFTVGNDDKLDLYATTKITLAIIHISKAKVRAIRDLFTTLLSLKDTSQNN